MSTTKIRIDLSAQERIELEHMVRARTLSHAAFLRARTVLLIATGETISSVARELDQDRKTVRKWAKRFASKRLDGGLDELPRSGRPAGLSPRSGVSPGEARLRAT